MHRSAETRSAAIRPAAAWLALAALGLLLAGCATSPLGDLDGATPAGSAFDQALFRDYEALARSVDVSADPQNNPGFFSDPLVWLGITAPEPTPSEMLADAFADKALIAAKGEDVQPEPAGDPESQAVRARVLQAVNAGKDRFAEDAARVQADYDCWRLDASVPAQAAAAAACRAQLNASLARLEADRNPAPPPPPPPVPVAAAPAPAAAPADYTVHFDFDSWTLTAEDLTVLTNVIDTARAGRQTHITVVGHTDTAGPADYNEKLSVHRANVVVEALVDMGARRAAIQASGVGESDLAVATADGVREARNRRAVIDLLPELRARERAVMGKSLAKSYDYIVVGAGSAGAVLANRLSADPQVTVLLVEAGGPDNSLLIHMPAGVSSLVGKPNKFNWAFETEPQAQLNGRRLYWPRGRGWGGTSSINGMIYIRGAARDYDRWSAMGCEGWSFAELLPYFKRAEANENGADPFHGGDGPLHVSNPRSRNPLFAAFVKAAIEAGHPAAKDFNGATQDGFGPYQLTIRGGRRWNTASAYLRPALRRPNLAILSHAHVTRVLFERARATGIEFIQDGKAARMRTDREVILAAGAVNTPQLLLLSGIGDGETLRSFAIPVVADLKGVGRNLQDHLDVAVQQESLLPVTLHSQSRKLAKLKTGLQYLLFRKGVGTGQGLECGGFLKSRPGLEGCDLQFHFVAALVIDHMRKKADRHGFMTHVCQLDPAARGFISLRSADPLAAPLIQPNYLAGDGDLEVLRTGLRRAREIFAQPAFDPYRGREFMPGADIESDSEIDAWIRAHAETIYHPVGSARMGQDEDAVVDPRLNVRGVAGLRVCDASVMPRLVSGNTNAPTIMIAEKASDMILGRDPAPG